MNINKLFLMACGLIVLSFGLYVSAPAVRDRLTPKPIPAETPMTFVASTSATPTAAVSKISTHEKRTAPTITPASATTRTPSGPTVASMSSPALPRLPILFGILPPNQLGLRIVTFPLLAGQELSLSNTEFTFIKIESDYPVSAQIDNCKDDQTKFLSCNNISLNQPVIVRDLRNSATPDLATRNLVKITAVKP